MRDRYVCVHVHVRTCVPACVRVRTCVRTCVCVQLCSPGWPATCTSVEHWTSPYTEYRLSAKGGLRPPVLPKLFFCKITSLDNPKR
jgi:hypothetical protein